MTFVVAWLVFPLVLALLSLGCGLLVETIAGVRLRAALLVPLGYAAVVVIAQLATLSSETAELAAPAVAACAVVGLGLGARGRRPDPWPALVGAAAYVLYSLPVAASGQATFAGYIKLDDTSTYLAMLDRIVDAGRSLTGLAPSTYEATLATSLDYGYPVGSLVPLGVGSTLLGTDPAWLWQPHLSFLGALLALGLYALLPSAVGAAPRAVAAVVAAQPALLFGYALWGGIKELASAALLAAGAAAFGVMLRAPSARAAVVPAVVCAALVGVLSVGGAAWLGPLVLGAGVLAVVLLGARPALDRAGVFALALVVCSMPAIVAAFEWLPRSRGFASEDELANLGRPLRVLQLFGIWPVGDFRVEPGDLAPVYLLIALVAVAAAAGAAWAISTRRWTSLLYVAATLVGSAALWLAGSPWIGGKAIAVASPAVLFLAALGCLAAVERGRRIEAGVAAAAIVAGVVWSNVLAYHEVWLAPRDRLAELERIGERFAREGPALMTEFEPYGARHFLRELDPEGASELRRRFVNLRSGQPLAPQGYADVDRFQLSELLVYRTLVLRRSPVASRPPSGYDLVERGRWYEVWQRPDRASAIVEHLPLGTETDPAAVPPCGEVERLAALPGVFRVAAAVRGPVVSVPLDADSVRLPEPGLWGVWVGGSFVGRMSAVVAGSRVGEARHQLEWTGQYVELGAAELGRGVHGFAVREERGGLRPGSGGATPFPTGPVVFALDAPARVVAVAPEDARSLCGRRLDWVEALG